MLKQQFETGDIPRKFKVMYALMGMFMVAMPKRTKVEEVDKAGW